MSRFIGGEDAKNMAFRAREIQRAAYNLAQPPTCLWRLSMRVTRWTTLAWTTLIVGCASAAATNVLTPLGAHLSSGAKTGAVVPLRFDPNARVVISTAANLPAASYSAAQATRGEKVFDQTCSTCHQAEKFIGPEFVQNWNDRRVGDFYSLVRSTMPVDNPGGLKEQEYLDVTAYLLKANHSEPKADSLSTDTTVMRGRKISVRN
jgi:mono/diheme cytochrome c family protein